MSMAAAIVGVGSSKYSLDSEQTEEQLAVTAIRAALADAELEEQAVDGMVRYSADSNDFAHLLRVLDIDSLSFYGEIPYGGLATCGAIAHAAAAVDARLAETVVVFRALNGRSGVRFGRAERFQSTQAGMDENTLVAVGDRTPGGSYAAPFGLLAPAQVMAMWAHRYAAVNAISEDQLVRALGTIAVTQRAYAQNNPRAITRGTTLSLDQHRRGRMIATPLRVYDLCRESDGAAAVVVSKPRNRNCVRIRAAAQHLIPYGEPTQVYPADLTRGVPEGAVTALYTKAALKPADIDVAAVYDATTVTVLLALEDYGFCGRGEAVDFVLGGALGLDGRIPINTAGGLLSEAYVHGLNLVVDMVEQLRGTSRNQVRGAELALVASRGGSLILSSS
jgi:acetyl-CoA acetyltransferase